MMPQRTSEGSTAADRLTHALKKEALRLGFLSVGIAPPETIETRKANLSRWLSSGFAGKLSYMERFFERQSVFLKEFPDLKSIIVLTIPYGSPSSAESEPDGEISGRIARYAQGKDYHKTIPKKLALLENFLRREAGESLRVRRSIDTAPVQERALAESAGLGFIGKNTCLIQPKGGSFVFLAALLTNLELIADNPIEWDCGACTLCLEACPTGALSPDRPYQLDAGLCIANQTIENRETILLPLRAKIGHWIFGCDICQEICPYNKKTEHSPWPEFRPENGAGTTVPLAEILAIRTEEAFLARFAGTPLMRPKREGLLRNTAVAAGNSKDPSLVPALQMTAQDDPSEIVREHARWALRQLQKP